MSEDTTPRLSRILIVDDDEDILRAAQLCLRGAVDQVDILADPRRIPSAFSEFSYDVVLLDMNFTCDATSGREGLNWLSRILQIDPDAVVVLITAYGDAETAVRAIKSGATDFITKPWQNEKLVATVVAGIRLRRSRLQVQHLQYRQDQLHADLDQPFREIIGNSVQMQGVFRMIEKVAATDANVLIAGENGTGKELAARAIHRHSLRKDRIFCRVDLSALTGSLFESELFGHVKGAFTDAHQDRAGRFEVATGGTLFLDEISNLPLSLQPKLLTAIQERQVTRVGSNTPIDVDVRIISASNQPLDRLVEEARFREDLFYRINTVTIHLPPLRERGDDVELLAESFLSLYSRKYQKRALRMNAAARSRLREYHWPGNVRELQHAIERAVILCDGAVLRAEDLVPVTPAAEDSLLFGNRYDLKSVERAAIRRALAKCGGNVTRAATALGLTRASLYRRMQKHGL
jgi:two-component system response regulator HydG